MVSCGLIGFFFEVCLYLFVHLFSILMSSDSEIEVLWSWLGGFASDLLKYISHSWSGVGANLPV